MKSSDIIKLLQEDGWVLDRVRGSHNIFTHPTKSGHVVVPHPQKDFPLGTLRNIFKQAGLPVKR
jgi:predicted RNA binding protein YcfA (HicA-like mRNA interferase family)